MSKHEITLHENTGVTKAVAPYLGTYQSKETVRLDAFVDTLATKCGLPAIQVQAILQGAFNEIETLESDEGLVRLNLDGFTVSAAITGSFATADAAFDPEKNALELVLRLDDDIRLALVNVTPTILGSATESTRVRVDRVADTTNPRPYNIVYGQQEFRVHGLNLVLDDEGAEVKLQDAMGALFDVTVDEVASKQLFRGHANELIPAGDYKLIVKSRGGDAAGELQRVFRKVKVIATVTPSKGVHLTTAKSYQNDPSDGTPGTIYGAESVALTGENLAYSLGDIVTFQAGANTANWSGADAIQIADDGNTLLLDYTKANGTFAANDGETVTFTFKGATVNATFKDVRG